MAEFTPVARKSDLPNGGKLTLEVADRLVVLVRVDDSFFCIDDVCTHDGGPLGEGELCGFEIACPRHGAKFDVRDGKVLTMPATENTGSHEVRLIGDEIHIRIRD